MADKPLNFNPDDLGAFDNAPDPDDELAAFDNATEATVIPPGWYLCKLEAGEYLSTKNKNKPAFRLRFLVVDPTTHAGFTLWRYYLLDAGNANRSKAALAPLGIRTSADVRRAPFPEIGRTILCKVLVAIQKNDPTRNDVEQFTVESDERTDTGMNSATRFALPEDKKEGDSAP